MQELETKGSEAKKVQSTDQQTDQEERIRTWYSHTVHGVSLAGTMHLKLVAGY